MTQRFFALTQIVGSQYETRATPLEPVHIGTVTDCQRCPECGEPGGSLPWLPPYRAELTAYGHAIGDIAFPVGMELVVSCRFSKAWNEETLRGLDFTPLERYRARPARLAKQRGTYFHCSIRYFSTRADSSRSDIEYDGTSTCDLCKSGAGIDAIRGFCIDESSWTGEDIFYAWGMPGAIIVSDRVRKLRDEYGLTNVNLIPVEKYCWTPLQGVFSADEPPRS